MGGARLAVVTGILVLSACGQAPGAGTSHDSAQASPNVASATSAGSSQEARCATSQLRFSLGKSAAATSNQVRTINVANASGPTCYLGGYPGVELLDGAGNHLQDAQRSTDSFFGSYAASHRVDLQPGAATTFDLTFVSNDPCTGGAAGQHGAALKITPPGDYDSSTIPAPSLVCPNTLVVHPVGSPTPSG